MTGRRLDVSLQEAVDIIQEKGKPEGLSGSQTATPSSEQTEEVKPPSAPVGSGEANDPRRTRIAVPGREKLNVSYDVVEADEVQASHLPSRGFEKNAKYAFENERRYHAEPASRAKVLEAAAQLDPDRLMEAPDANQGAPIVDQDGNVLGGNGRAMSIQRAYETPNSLSAQTYRNAVIANAGRLGLDPTSAQGMNKPILIRRVDENLSMPERQGLISALNEEFTHSRDIRSESKSRGDRFSQRTLKALAVAMRDADSLRQMFDSPGSASIVEMLVKDGVIQESEKNALVGTDGLLNPDGKTVVERSLRGRIARKYETLAALSNSVVGKLDAAVPHILCAEQVGKQWNITEDVRDAVDLLAEFSRSGEKETKIFLSRPDMFSGKAPRERFNGLAVRIFESVLTDKKADFTDKFARYSRQADISPENNGLGGGLTAPQAQQQIFGATAKKPEPEAEKGSKAKPDSVPVPAPAPPSTPPAPTLVSKQFGPYNDRRYSRPWGAKITLAGEKTNYSFDGKFYGDADSGGTVEIPGIKPGDVVAFGQKDTRGSGSGTYNEWFIVQADGSLEKTLKDAGVKHLRERRKAEAQQPKPSETSAPAVLEAKPAEPAPASPKDEATTKAASLSEHIAALFADGRSFTTIVDARKEAAAFLGEQVEAGTARAKEVEEAIELAVVLRAREIVADMREKDNATPDADIFRALVKLYDQQPILGSRSSTSIAQQAYSTPVPLAFLASRLAGISGRTTVYEPTAGNGALLIEASPKNTETNELNPERAKNLEKQGFTVTQSDAAAFTPERTVDVVIANPPFGTVKNADGQSREFEVPVGGVVFATYDLDHAIVARALLSMKGDGRAVLIIGGKQGHDEMKRQKYRAASQIKFYKMLYENYSVLDHFTIDGKLYAKQGAAYPIDVIVIGGKGKTEGRPFPGGKLPRVYESFDALEEVIVNGQKRSDLVGLSGNPAGSGNEVVDSGVEGVEGGVRGELGGLRGGSSSGAGGGISGDVGGHNGGGLQRPSDGKTSEDSGRDSERGGLGSSDGRGPGKPLHGGNDVVQPVRHPGERVGDNESGGVEQDSGAILAVRDFSGESQRDKKPDVGRPSEQSGRPAESSAATQHVKRESTTYQNPYQPASKGASLEVYIPKNMGTAARDALGKIEAITGSIDQYVADALDYSEQELHKYFSAEQIDALALAIHNMTAGKGFIIGDMTGIGKGRVNAAILRWAKLQGHIPVFVTQKDQLYSDMGRDLADIGMKNFRAIATNESLSSREGNQSYIEFQGKGIKGGKTLLPDVTQNGTKNYDAVFTTYAQISGNNDRPTPRRRFLESIAARAVFILDEAHTGGGEQQKAKKGSSENIAAFLYSLLKSSPQGVFYSSATYAKRPDNMILYFKTDIRDAVNDIKSLPETIKQGGVPLQQVVASMLTEAGQYLRREHSYQGVNVNTKTIAVPKENAVASAQIMTQIMNFSDYVEAVVKSIDNSLADLGGAAGENQSTGDKGASSTSFSSIMHNLISQFLLAQKAEATALSATEKVNQGKKVVIALQNTLEAPMKTFIEAHNLKVGDAFRLTFSDLFKNYLEQTRMITEKTGAVDHKNKPIKIKRRLTDEELGPAGVALYNSVLGIIEKSRLDLPVSPIDHILHRLREMGVKAGEITGRGYIVDYSGGGSTLARRTTGAGINKQATDDFNNGMIDALIINTSGSTGISLHSSKTFKDQKQRVMIISQAALDINTFVQTLGRVFRTGQVNLPEYELLFSDLPIEKRPAAVLAKKMASLNANTTASGKSDTSFKDTVDFMNEYGDEIVNMVLGENPELISRMGLGDSRQITIAQLTGRIPLLPLDLQEEVYAAIEMEYENHIQQLKDAGQYSLEAQSLPLDAKLISETEFIKAVDANGASPFSQGANLGVYDVKRIGKPFTSEKVKEKIRQGKEELVPFEKVLENNNKYYRKQTEDMDEEKAGSLYSKLQGALSKLRHIYRFYSVGNEVSVSFGEKDIVRGIVTSISRRSGGGKNPVALSAWSVRIALADARREIDVPVSQIMRDNEENKNAIEVTPLNREAKDGLFNMFDNGQSESREDVVIATGNILAAFDALIQKNRGARIISFTDNEGNTRLGVLMRGASVEELMSSSNVALSISQSLQYLNTVKPNAGIVRLGSDRDFVIVRNNTGNFNISVPAARARGQQYYGNRAILAAAGQDFFKVGQSMVLRNLDERTLRRIMDVLEQQGRGFVTDVNTDVARDIVKGEDPLASLSPAGEHMPPPGPTIGSRSVRHTRITSAVEKVQKLATRAAETKIVRSFAELPTHIKQRFKGRESALEGVYDPGTDTVYLVTENLASGERAVEVWLHENLVHHGLRSLFRKGELSRLLNRLWDSQGGMGNAMIREIAERYELDPRSNMEARHKVMEEYLANLAEKASIGELTGQEATWWRRFIAALREAWQRIVSAATGRNGRMGTKEIDRLLRTLGRHVFEGTAGGGEGRTAADPAFSLRTRPDPKKTKIAYKLFRVRKDAPGKLFPLYVGRNEAVELGVWHDAEIGEQAADGKVKSKLGPLAMRPGWHAGDVPMATHIGGKEPGDTAPSYRQEDQVWAEVEVAHDVDWQAEADRRAQRSKSGQKIPRTAHITDSIPEDGLYRYKTNPNMTGNWIISGAMRVNRILSDAEVADINAEHGLADLPRKAPFDAEAYGFEAPLASLKTILGIKPSNAASAAASPQIRVFLDKEDLGLWERLSSLPHWIAKNFPAFAKVYDRQLKRMDERSAMLEKSLKEVSLLFGKSAKTLSKEDMADANRIIWEHEGKDIPELKDIEKFLPDGKLESGRTKLKVNPAYRTAYRAWLSKQKGSDKAKELVEQIRSSLDNDLLLAYNRMAEMRELNDTDIDKYRMAIGHQQNYFPHHRYGDYYVQAKVNGEVVYRKHFDLPVTMPVKSLKRNQLKAYADEVAREQAGNFPDAEWSVGENTRLPEEALGAPIDTEAMEQIILAAAAGIKDPAHRKDVIDTLKAGSADVLKARGFGSHYIGRKGIPGHETEDILKILYDYKAGLTGWLTKMEASRDLTRALGDINAKSQPNLWAYAQQYVKDMLRNSDRLDRMTGNIKAVAFAWYLGGSIKTAMVNATQNIVVGVPRLSMDANGSALSWIKSAGDALIRQATGKTGSLTADEARLIDELYGEAVISDAYMEEVRGQLRGIGGNIWNKFTKVLGMPMSAVERFNRASLALAAYQLARKGNLKPAARKRLGMGTTMKADYETAKKFASEVVRDAHFVYGKSNTPEFLRSNAAGRGIASAYTFRTFTHNMLRMWAWALASQGTEGRKFVAKSIGATIAIGGLTAIPFYATMQALVQAATDDDDDWTETIRKALPKQDWLRDIAVYGMPTLGGMYVGGSLKMETPATHGIRKGGTLKETIADIIGDMIGIPYDLLVNKTTRIMDAKKNQNWYRMVEEASPVALKNGLQAWRLYTEGQTSMKGRPINDPGGQGARKISGTEAGLKALGFPPVSATKSWDAYMADKRREQVRSDKIDQFTVQTLKAQEQGDTAAKVAVRKDIEAWNTEKRAEGKPSMVIKLEDVQRRVTARKRENSGNKKVTPKAAAQAQTRAAAW
ncbi:MAG: PLxRFG domain-containing protein [Desulfovibrio sp.]|nr:PLxRFG domain-containing protein [Desulfovibrio sp.]